MKLTLTHAEILRGESPPAERPRQAAIHTDEHRIAVDIAAIYDQYFTPVYNYLRYRVEDARTADDLTAQVFERVLQHLDRYQPERAAFQTWLFAIARHVAGDYFRAQRRQRRWWLPFSLDDLYHEPAEAPALETTVITREANARLLEAVARLSARERDLIALRFGAELSHREIAALTGVTENHAGVIMHRALRRLRNDLEGVFDDE